MSIHFAAAKPSRASAASPAAARQIFAKAQRVVANDNPYHGQKNSMRHSVSGKEPGDQVLRAALNHFAQFGLGAAKVARARAEKAFFDGDRETYDWWLGITRTLDRRIAASVSGQSGQSSHANVGLPFLVK